MHLSSWQNRNVFQYSALVNSLFLLTFSYCFICCTKIIDDFDAWLKWYSYKWLKHTFPNSKISRNILPLCVNETEWHDVKYGTLWPIRANLIQCFRWVQGMAASNIIRFSQNIFNILMYFLKFFHNIFIEAQHIFGILFTLVKTSENFFLPCPFIRTLCEEDISRKRSHLLICWNRKFCSFFSVAHQALHASFSWLGL